MLTTVLQVDIQRGGNDLALLFRGDWPGLEGLKTLKFEIKIAELPPNGYVSKKQDLRFV